MNSRERVQRAVDFQKPDRVPYTGLTLASDILPLALLTPRNWQPSEGYFPYVQKMELDFGTWRSKKRLPWGWIKKKHEAIDEWGVIWERHGAITTLGQVLEGPIKTWDDLDTFTPPDPHVPGRYSLMTKIAKLVGRKRYRLPSLGNCLWERYHFLRGWENSMMDVARPNPNVERLLDMLVEYFEGVAQEWIDRGVVDGIIAVDDLGGQGEPLMSPRSFNKLFKPRYERIAKLCHDHGKHFFMHSCGDVKALAPSLVEAGLDCFQFDGPDQTGIEWCSEHLGGKVAFMDVVDIQNVLPAGKGTHEDIVNYVKKLIYYLARFDGGLIGCEYATVNVLKAQPNAYKVMRRTFREFGKYPLDMERLKPDKDSTSA